MRHILNNLKGVIAILATLIIIATIFVTIVSFFLEWHFGLIMTVIGLMIITSMLLVIESLFGGEE